MVNKRYFHKPQEYDTTLSAMKEHVEAIASGERPEEIWWLEHEAVITAGTSARAEDLINAGPLPVIPAGRGGQYTIHNPGQRVIYPMIKAERTGGDVRAYLRILEQWIINGLQEFGISAYLCDGQTGVWVQHNGRMMPK